MDKPDLSFSSIAERARRTSRGSLPPAGVDPDAAPEAGPDGRARRAIRQRLRRTRRVRDARVAELGVLVADMERQERWNGDLVDAWVRELDATDAELRGLEQVLRAEGSLDDLIARHVVARCDACGRLAGASDGFCTGCGSGIVAGASKAGMETGVTGNTMESDLTTIRPA